MAVNFDIRKTILICCSTRTMYNKIFHRSSQKTKKKKNYDVLSTQKYNSNSPNSDLRRSPSVGRAVGISTGVIPSRRRSRQRAKSPSAVFFSSRHQFGGWFHQRRENLRLDLPPSRRKVPVWPVLGWFPPGPGLHFWGFMRTKKLPEKIETRRSSGCLQNGRQKDKKEGKRMNLDDGMLCSMGGSLL